MKNLRITNGLYTVDELMVMSHGQMEDMFIKAKQLLSKTEGAKELAIEINNVSMAIQYTVEVCNLEANIEVIFQALLEMEDMVRVEGSINTLWLN